MIYLAATEGQVAKILLDLINDGFEGEAEVNILSDTD